MLRNLAFACIATATLSGCALTEYPVLTDEDNSIKVIGSHVVQTNGKAAIKQKLQVAVIKPGGETREMVWFMDQKDDGSRTIYNYVNVGNISCIGSGCVFHGQVYINNNQDGCWVVRAPAGGPLFDAEENMNCPQWFAHILLAKFTRNNEAGADPGFGKDDNKTFQVFKGQSMAGVTLEQGLNLAQTAVTKYQFGAWSDYGNFEGYRGTISPSDWTFELAPTADGVRTAIAIDGQTFIANATNKYLLLDLRTGNTKAVLNQIADWIDANGRSGKLYVTFAGTTGSFDVGFLPAKDYRDAAEKF